MKPLNKMNEKNGSFSFTKLNNRNYSAWAFKMKMYLMKENCWKPIEHVGEFDEPLGVEDIKAWNHIILGIDDDQHVHVDETTGGREAWIKLKSVHVQVNRAMRVRVLRSLFETRLQKDSTVSMEEHLQKLLEGLSRLTEIGYKLKNDMAVSIILASLGSDYEQLVQALETWDDEHLTIEVVRSKLLDEWQRKQQYRALEGEETALQSTRKDLVCFGCGKKGHIKKYCRSLYKSATGNQANAARFAFSAVEQRVAKRKKKIVYRICYHCREAGHQSDSCPSKSVLKRNSEIESVQSAKMERLNNMYSFVSLNENNPLFQNWIIDSGASSHMCSDRNLFSDIQFGSFGDITIASGDKISAKGQGTVTLCVGLTDKRLEIILLNVLYVPNLETNLMSVKKITEKGFSVNFSKYGCHLNGGGASHKIGQYSNGVYELLQPKFHRAAAVRTTLCVHEWHRRLAHRHLGDVKKLSDTGIKFKSCKCSDLCDACIKGKMSRKPFPQVAEKKTERLQCIVSDLCGPMQVESVGKSKYFITFTDLFSGYTETNFMRSKDETTEKVIQFVEKLKTALNDKPKIFRSDRGKEYMNHRLQSYFKKEGIKFESTVAYSPQQNGVSERKNRTLVEAARTMLISSSLPKKYWAEAVHNATYTFNRIPRNEKTPYELMFNKTAHCEFREFGCDVYVMFPYEKRRKLDNKAEIMKFLGCDENSKGFRVLGLNGAIKISRDVTFADCQTNQNEVNAESCDLDPTADVFDASYEKEEDQTDSDETLTEENSESESDHEEDQVIDNTVVSISDDSVFESINGSAPATPTSTLR